MPGQASLTMAKKWGAYLSNRTLSGRARRTILIPTLDQVGTHTSSGSAKTPRRVGPHAAGEYPVAGSPQTGGNDDRDAKKTMRPTWLAQHGSGAGRQNMIAAADQLAQ